ncbi:copper amine oxidase N-terminal domain-containing protein [Paenibacillus methanolicus]|uniref:Copper amine oxidase-like protein n=1 Tax=Paenibacillus methanolicus TaxID=582686 RepID=A0A5S5C8U4_9BACL|nr:copper amine oxidase N-terminal domain-containing protein [Paenibacillus methanolicus]TYP74750.1 copper amine oxidase-like protein [Paenibacillus methanolicus]
MSEFKRSKRIAVAALAAALAMPVLAWEARDANAATAASSEATGIRITMNGSLFQPETPALAINGTIYLPVRDTGELLDTVVDWHGSVKLVSMTYPKLTVRLALGSDEAIVNGKPRKLTTPLRSIDGRIYVPMRFFSEAMDADVSWQPAERTVAIKKKDEYAIGGGTWINRETGQLYISRPSNQAPVEYGRLETTGFKGELALYGYGHDGLYLFADTYGEPKERKHDVYGVFILNKKIVAQRKATYSGRLEERFGTSYQYLDENAKKWVQVYLLSDGRKVAFFSADGIVIREHDLTALTGKEDNYAVLGAGEDFIVVRPESTGYVTLINLKDRATAEMYDKLLKDADLERVLGQGGTISRDDIQFIGEDRGTLYFGYRRPNGKGGYDFVRLSYVLAAGLVNVEPNGPYG